MYAMQDRRSPQTLSMLARALLALGAILLSQPEAAGAQQTEPPPRTQAAKGDLYQQALQRALAQFRLPSEGKNADHIPALAKVDAKLYGIAQTPGEEELGPVPLPIPPGHNHIATLQLNVSF